MDSLTSEQVSLLLRSLKLHRSLLDATHQDAVRLMDGTRPCYVVDYQLLHRFMYNEDDNAEALVEFLYLLQQDEVQLILGHGTAIEILYRVQRTTGIPVQLLQSVSGYESFIASFPILSTRLDETLADVVKEAPQHGRAIARLADVLQHKNVQYIWHIEGQRDASVLDREAYNAALGVLNSVRKKRYYPNAADAMNFADVVGLRRLQVNNPSEAFPFLLTDTRPLLDEARWANDPVAERLAYTGQVSRNPLTAIYSHLFLPNDVTWAQEATTKTIDLAFEIALLERTLRKSKGYKQRVSLHEGDDWEDIATHKRVTPSLSRQLTLLSDFLSDPIVTEFQRIYDNSRLTVANWTAQRGDVNPIDSPQRVFDVVMSVAKVLNEQAQPDTGVANLWSSLLERHIDPSPEWTTLTYRQTGQSRPAGYYLQVERQAKFTTFRWPNGTETPDLLKAFTAAFRRHGVSEVVFYAGTDSEVISFRCILPVTNEDLRSGIQEASEKIEGLGQVLWLRMSHELFDLYADLILTEGPDEDSIIGVSVSSEDALDGGHLRELYWATSRRFLFGSWFDSVVADATSGQFGLNGADAW
ncbi:MAG: hypothetical protein JWP75_2477 [Frondihabitans sp.]|jgi:hypothetical protein|nr:hypothetical protein [Frondihabitans sp.]